jgi:predicted ArsR family transcriptional regulator
VTITPIQRTLLQQLVAVGRAAGYRDAVHLASKVGLPELGVQDALLSLETQGLVRSRRDPKIAGPPAWEITPRGRRFLT